MKNQKSTLTIIGIMFGIVFFSCEPEAVVTDVVVTTQTGEEEEFDYVNEGYLVASQSNSSAGNTIFVDYFETKPTGDLNLIDEGESLPRFIPEAIYKNFIYGRNREDATIMTRYAVDPETKRITETGSLQVNANVSVIKILDDQRGVFTIFDTQSLFVFNPMTMELIQEIPLTGAITYEVEGDPTAQENNYFHIIHRIQDDRIFLPLNTNISNTPQFYDAEDVVVEVVNLNTMSWESNTRFEQATQPITRGAENYIVDENGNVYITCQGQYTLDGQIGAFAAPRSRPQILKIPAGSTEFDADYSFNPVNVLGFSTIVSQFVTGAIYESNGIAYAAISAKEDLPRVNELLVKLAGGIITDNEFDELVNLVLNTPSSRWAKLDLNAQTVEVIADIPLTAGFAFPLSYKYDDKLYFQVINSDLGLNGYYEFNPQTNSSNNIFNISIGGLSVDFIKLQE